MTEITQHMFLHGNQSTFSGQWSKVHFLYKAVHFILEAYMVKGKEGMPISLCF